MLSTVKIRLSVLMIFLLTLPAENKEVCAVKRVIDGDTLKVKCGGTIETVRLIGVDTAESKKNRKAMRDAERTGQSIESIISNGKKNTVFVRGIVRQGDQVIIEYDRQKRDRYRRLLGYVYLQSGEMLNEKLLKTGHAVILTIRPNVRYLNRFLKIYKDKY